MVPHVRGKSTGTVKEQATPTPCDLPPRLSNTDYSAFITMRNGVLEQR